MTKATQVTHPEFAAAQRQGKPNFVQITASWWPVRAEQPPILNQIEAAPKFKGLVIYNVAFDIHEDRVHATESAAVIGMADWSDGAVLSRRLRGTPSCGVVGNPALAAATGGATSDDYTRLQETPRMINKIVQSMADMMAGIKDGSVVLLGGFGAVGQPNVLIDGLIEQGATNLTVACNNAGVGHTGLARLMELERVSKIVCSFPRSSDPVVFETLYRAGKIELEIVPQGTLAERMRAAGAGVPAFFTATGVGTKMAVGKEHREIDGRLYILEQALKGDVGLVEAWEADRWGNLTFRQAGRNFNPICAMASELTLVQTQHIRELGEINPDHVVTPGIFVDRVLHAPYGDPSGF